MSENKVKVHLATSQSCLPENELSAIYLMLQLKQPKIDLERNRLPLNVSFVLDRSGSMSGSKLEYTREAVAFALSNLDPDDTVSVVAFDDLVEVPVPATGAENTDYLKQLLQGLYARGTTNLSGGLLEGADQVKKNYRKDAINRVVLLTDGLANEGVSDPARLVELVKNIYGGGISVSALGVGDDFHEDLLVDMAEAGNGNFYFIASPEAIPEIFKEELQGLLSVTGQNPVVEIHPKENVRVHAVFGYEPVFNDGATIKLPDIYNGDTKTVLAELHVQTGASGMMPLARVNFRYYDVVSELSTVSYDMDLSLEVSSDAEKIRKGIDLRVHKEVEIFKAAQAREDAFKEADRGDFEASRRRMKKQAKKLRLLYEECGDDEIKAHLEDLEKDMEAMDTTTYSATIRKEMKDKSFRTRRRR